MEKKGVQIIKAIVAVVLICMGSGCALSYYIRLDNVKKSADPAFLARMALEDKRFDIREAAVENPNLTDQTVLAKVAMEDELSQVRRAAVKKITDQSLLARLSIEAKDNEIRQAAVGKLTDQAVLAKVTTEEQDARIRQIAVERLTDQALLIKVAIEEKNADVRRAAVMNPNLTDQAVLAKFALMDFEGDDLSGRLAVITKLTDQVVLARLVTEDKNSNVRLVAAQKLTDQSMLAKVAIKDKFSDVRHAAVQRLSDQSMLFRVSNEDQDLNVRLAAIANLDDQKLLGKLADITDKQSGLTRDAIKSFARIKLAIQEPRIKSFFPGLQCVANVVGKNQYYVPEGGEHHILRDSAIDGGGYKRGEKISIMLFFSDKTLIEMSWSTNFPTSTSSLSFLGAEISGEDLLEKLFHLSDFTLEDLIDLVHSNIPEVRIGAVANLIDPTVLAKVANEDINMEVREAAKKRIAALRR